MEHPHYHSDYQVILSLGVNRRRLEKAPGGQGPFLVAVKNGCRCAPVEGDGDLWVSMAAERRPRLHPDAQMRKADYQAATQSATPEW